MLLLNYLISSYLSPFFDFSPHRFFWIRPACETNHRILISAGLLERLPLLVPICFLILTERQNHQTRTCTGKYTFPDLKLISRIGAPQQLTTTILSRENRRRALQTPMSSSSSSGSVCYILHDVLLPVDNGSPESWFHALLKCLKASEHLQAWFLSWKFDSMLHSIKAWRAFYGFPRNRTNHLWPVLARWQGDGKNIQILTCLCDPLHSCLWVSCTKHQLHEEEHVRPVLSSRFGSGQRKTRLSMKVLSTPRKLRQTSQTSSTMVFF